MIACKLKRLTRFAQVLPVDPQAFTLLEMVLVMGIIALLMGVVVLCVQGLPAAAQVRARAMEEEVVQKAVDAYLAGGSAAPLAPRPAEAAAPICAQDADAPFARYLRACTTYAYWWDVHAGERPAVALRQVE